MHPHDPLPDVSKASIAEIEVLVSPIVQRRDDPGEVQKAHYQGSQQLHPTQPFAFIELSDEIISPPIDLRLWASQLARNTRLSRGIRTIARNTVGLGWSVEPEEPVTQETPEAEQASIQEEVKRVSNFFKAVNKKKPFSALMECVVIDEEATGNGYLEFTRTGSGQLDKAYHVMSTTVRILKDNRGFVQIREGDHRYFKNLGDERVMDARTGKFAGEAGFNRGDEGALPAEHRATEILHFSMYHPMSEYYGLPRFIPAGAAIAGNFHAAKRNVSFFQNDAPVPLTSLVLTPCGWTTMGDLAADDAIIGADGQAHRVSEILPQGEQEIWRVHFMDGASAECTLNHTWTVSNNYDRQRGVTRNMTLQELLHDGLSYDSGPYKWAVPLAEPIVFQEQAALPLDPYLLGFWLGNGWSSQGHVGVAGWLPDLDETRARIASLLPSGMRITTRERRTTAGGSGGYEMNLCRPANSYHNPIKGLLQALELEDTRARTKFIPEVYLRASIADRLSLLQGLVDSDGHIGDTFVRYTTVSAALAADVVDLVGSLGGTATIAPVSGRETLNVTIKQLPEDMVPVRLERKVRAYRPKETLRWRTIVSAEPVGVAPTQCIRTTSPDALYVMDGYVVTHNCPRMAVLVSGGQLDGKSKEAITKLFQEGQGPEQAHRIVVLETTSEGIGVDEKNSAKLELKPLTVNTVEDGSFLNYRRQNDEEIREALGLSEVFFKSEKLTKASAVVAKATTDEQEFAPARGLKEYLINQLVVKDALGASRVLLKFSRPQTSDPVEKSQVNKVYSDTGALSVNEVRADIGKPPLPVSEEWANLPMPLALLSVQGKLIGSSQYASDEGVAEEPGEAEPEAPAEVEPAAEAAPEAEEEPEAEAEEADLFTDEFVDQAVERVKKLPQSLKFGTT